MGAGAFTQVQLVQNKLSQEQVIVRVTSKSSLKKDIDLEDLYESEIHVIKN